MTTIDDAQAMLAELFAPWVQDLGLRVTAVAPGEVTLVLPFDARLARVGGTVCGQAMMAAADSAMVLAVMTHLGGFKPMTTVQLQTSFLRPIGGDAGSVRVLARVLRMGRKLVFGEVLIHDPQMALAAHATTTYSLL